MVDAGLLISIRAKLCKPGFFKVEVSCIMMLYYNDVFIINMIIFFMAMPSGLISSFGNWMYLSYWVLLMSFPRLNNLSYWLIPVPLMLILSACLLDSSCATSRLSSFKYIIFLILFCASDSGGNPLIYLFWLFGHPEDYTLILILSNLYLTGKKEIFGSLGMIYAILRIALIELIISYIY